MRKGTGKLWYLSPVCNLRSISTVISGHEWCRVRSFYFAWMTASKEWCRKNDCVSCLRGLSTLDAALHVFGIWIWIARKLLASGHHANQLPTAGMIRQGRRLLTGQTGESPWVRTVFWQYWHHWNTHFLHYLYLCYIEAFHATLPWWSHDSLSTDTQNHPSTSLKTNMYIYRERERGRESYVNIYIYVYLCNYICIYTG